jgi:O-antigen/teichoic acid export membrane protein
MRSVHALPPGAEPALAGGYLSREGAVFLVLNLGLQAMLRLDTFMLAALGVAKERIGLYGAAAAPVWGLLGVAQLIAVAAYPTLARAATEHRLNVRRALAVALAGAAIGAVLATAITLVRFPLIRLVFGPQYLESAQLVAVLAWVLPGACLDMLMGVLVAACGRQRWGLGTQAFVLLTAAIGELIAIPRWGLAGCAGVAVAVWSGGTLVAMTVATLAVRNPRSTGEAAPPAVEPE